MPKKNADKIAERRAAREKARQDEAAEREKLQKGKRLSTEYMNAFLETKEMTELLAKNNIVLPVSNYDRDRLWDKLIRIREFYDWLRPLALDFLAEDDEWGYDYTESDMDNAMMYVFRCHFYRVLEQEWSEANKEKILIYTLIVDRHSTTISCLERWKKSVGMEG